MAMLAEPRQKKRYHLTPKGKPLFEDNDRFGTKMLEKMGWSKGKGLGKSEDGVQDFIRVKYKSDEKGLGFQDRDDQWTEHEKNFNGLLQNLNGDTTGENSDECETITPTVGLGLVVKTHKKKLKDNISGQSLEERSKKSKARVHYQKFTKGKDMSQYSEKDLANIFGKKAAPEETNIYSQFQAFNVGGSDSDSKKDDKKESTSDEPKPPIINTGVSVNDYFKAKMAALKEKLGSSSSNPFSNNVRVVNNVKVFIPTAKRKRSTDEEVLEKEEENSLSKKTKLHDGEMSRKQVEEEVPRKKKKSKKHSIENEENVDLELVNESATKASEEPIEGKVEKEKKKRKKDAQPELTNIDEIKEYEDNSTSESSSSKKDKKKSKKSKEEIKVNEEHIETPYKSEEEVPKKKKKKNKKSTVENVSEETSEIPSSTEEQPPKESRTENIQTTSTPEANINSESIKPKKKNKKKDKKRNNDTEEVSSSQTDMTSITNEQNNLLDTYTISTFCAEKFRNIVPHQFQGSNLMDINGYGLNANLNLNIKQIPNDAERIMRLWSGTLDKYTHSTSKRKLYSTYVKKVKLARRTKSYIPDLRVKSITRKSMFQIQTCGL